MRGGRSHRANSLPEEVEGQEKEQVEKEVEVVEKVEEVEVEEQEKEEMKVVGGSRGLSRFKSRSLYKINELSQGGTAHIRTNFMNLK